ncbi:protein of unknown function DUF1501 [Chthoniobacter flavus Ellin428]|uniref:DUF1501 domain-containing protein n=1 Tax=Chthoniobacter flavus Ellin428 TaxID=497964 RepID=B4DBB9_9BACT|nr:DUF1501 domain-containing protein [Chthoniobacter flavus]EDY16307.1 protein of unknown function DUF1501 [Chthoniobacter flavus Ellin428]TCO84697.1 uncharacterized protein DUF1501 [Chthoniobacter flavus]
MQPDSSFLPVGKCPTNEHTLHRRLFLKGLAGGALASVTSFAGLFQNPLFAEATMKAQKRCILLWLCGGPSQFETWYPKPGRPTSGPFGHIPTKIPGIHFSSLMPQCARIADKLNIVRNMKTAQPEHLQAINLMQRGNPDRAGFTRPTLGSVLAHEIGQLNSPIPNFILLDPIPGGNEFEGFKAGDFAGWLGAKYSPVRLGGDYSKLLNAASDALPQHDLESRETLRQFLTEKFERARNSTVARSENNAFERMKGLAASADLFDLNKLPAKDRERYGPGSFAQHALLSRHLAEHGAPFVMVANGMNWDNHVFQHEIHQMLVPELDRVLFNLITDLEERGMLDSTLVIAMGEFGRTPWINPARGRDHYPTAWSFMMTGCGLKRGVVTGETDIDGVDVVGTAHNEQNLFATIFTALGINPYAEYDLPGLPTFHRVENKAEPIRDLLA